MDMFRNLFRPTDGSPSSSSTPSAHRGSTNNISDMNSRRPLPNTPMEHQQSPQSNPQSSQPQQNDTQPRSSTQQRARQPKYSPYSTQGPFKTRFFVSENFMLGAGAVIIQPSSGKVVIVQDGNRWFLPKGRKDLGESIEQAALREAYEESGYRCEFMPLYHWTNAPAESRLVYGTKHTEPLYVTMTSYSELRNRPPGEYLTFWYVCQIGPDAVRELGTGMPDEAGYVSHLVTYEIANQRLNYVEKSVLDAAFGEWVRSMEIDEQIPMTGEQPREEEQHHS